MIRLISLCLFMAFFLNSNAQNPTSDSLDAAVKSMTGVEQIDGLLQLMKGYLCRDNAKSMSYYREIVSSLKNVDYAKGEVESLKNYGTLQYCSGNLDSALFIYENALDLSLSHDLKSLSGAISNNMGTMYRLKADYQNALKNYKICYDLGVEMGDTLLTISSLDGMGVVHKKKGNTDLALENFLLVEHVANGTKYKTALLSSKINIASIYLGDKNNQLKETDLLETLRLANELEDDVSKASIYQLLGDLLFKKGNYEKAQDYMNQGLEIIEPTGERRVKTYLLQGIGNVYYAQEKYSEAVIINNKAIQLANEAGLIAILPLLYSNNASCFLQLKQYDKTIETSLESISFSEQTEQLEDNIVAYKYLAQAYAASGNSQKAYDTQVRYTDLNNDFRDKAQSKQLAELQTKYETEKKEAEIATLSQQAAIQDLKIDQRNQAIVIGLVGFALILIIVYFIFRERTIKKDRIQTELEHRFLRSQLNPHFIFNALLAIQNFMLKNDGQAAALYLTKFSKLMRQILESSREEFIPVEEEIEMLKNYMDIHQLRLQNSFAYSIEIAEDIDPETDTIPPMFVQPFIENAIEHGIVNAKEKGLIEVSLKKVAGYIHIEIKDNGGGLIGGSSNPKEHNSLATTIIKERMELFNKSLKDQIQLILGDVRGENGEILGAKVELKVPFGYI